MSQPLFSMENTSILRGLLTHPSPFASPNTTNFEGRTVAKILRVLAQHCGRCLLNGAGAVLQTRVESRARNAMPVGSHWGAS